MYEFDKPIAKYATVTFSNNFFTQAGNSVWGTTGMRQTGSYSAPWGTLVSRSWSSGTKDIIGVEVVYGAVATTSSILQVSLQNFSASANLTVPDGTLLAKWTGSINPTASGKITRHTFDTPYTVSTGSKIVTVIEYLDRGPVLPSLTIGTYQVYTEVTSNCGFSLKVSTASIWQTSGDYLSAVRFPCSDGSTLYYEGGYAGMGGTDASIVNNYTSQSTGVGIDSGDERGMLWVPNKTYDISGFRLLNRFTDATSTADLCMYRDTTLLVSKSITTADNIFTSTPVGYGAFFDTPIRVNPGENIRITTKPTFGNARWYRFSWVSADDMKEFFGGEENETNFSITNRVDNGAWNTPTSASYSIVPFQIYGTEVTGSALLSGSYTISGSVLNQGVPVVGATIRAIKRPENIALTTSSNASGYYQFSNIKSGSYHLVVEYESGSQKYNALSSWNVPSV